MTEENPLENQLPEVDIDPWVDDDGVIDGEEIQEDLTSIASIAGMFQRQKTNQLMAEQRSARIQEQKRIAALPDCPYCGGKIPRVGLKVCKHCTREISWYKNICCIPGQEEQGKRRYKAAKQRAEKEAERRREEKRRKANESGLLGVSLDLAAGSVVLATQTVEYLISDEFNVRKLRKWGNSFFLASLLIPTAFFLVVFFAAVLFPSLLDTPEGSIGGLLFSPVQQMFSVIFLISIVLVIPCFPLGIGGLVSLALWKVDLSKIEDSIVTAERNRFAKRCAFWFAPIALLCAKMEIIKPIAEQKPAEHFGQLIANRWFPKSK